ncbi:MAG: hypothetical protein ACR2RF_11475 [Geminicoccaceae bacterium]
MTQPQPKSSSEEKPTPACDPASETEQPATKSGRFARVMALLSRSEAMRKIAALDWMEVVGMLSGAVILAIMGVGALLVAAPAILVVIPVAVPVAIVILLGVLLAKGVVRSAGDE